MTQPSYIKELDGLRAIAILLVLVWHYFLGQTTPDTITPEVWLGLSWTWSGVDLFFVLSGFLITRILLNFKDSPNYFKTFYARRVLRIFPPYYLLLIVYVVLVAAGITRYIPALLSSPIPIYSYFLYIQNIYMVWDGFGAGWMSVTWSLAVEEQFYLLFPLVIYYVNSRHLPKIFIVGILLAPIFRALIGSYGAYVLLPSRMDALLAGALIAYYYASGHITRLLAAHKRFLWWFTLLLFLIVIATLFKADGNRTGGVLNHTLYLLLYSSLLVTILVNEGSNSTRFFTNKVLGYIGKISYSVYLFHQIFIMAFYPLFLNEHIPWLRNVQSVWVTLAALAATFVAASLSYYLIEKPLQKYGRKFNY